MKLYVGTVVLHNGRYERSFQVRVHASHFRVAAQRAMESALLQLRKIQRRARIEACHIHLHQLKSSREVNNGD